MAKKDEGINPFAVPPYLTIEKISNGFLIVDPRGNKTVRRTMNGLVEFMEKHWTVKYITKEEPNDQVISEV